MGEASQIAADNLRACFRENGIVASVDHFSDFWARDSFFASWGLLEVGEEKKVRSNLELFLRHQSKDGQIPRRLDRCFTGLHYLGLKIRRQKLRPVYFGAQISPALDPNLLLIITAFRYVEKTNDFNFLETHFDGLTRALNWLANHESKGLLYEGPLANWMDTVIKKGAVFYSNVLYLEALRNFSNMAVLAGKNTLAQSVHQKAQILERRLNQDFWNGSYYTDWMEGGRRNDYFSTDGNVLAILFGLADEDRSRKIVSFIEKNWMDVVPLRTNYPAYPQWRVVLWMHLRGTPGYQNAYASWLWLGSIYVVALLKAGYKKKAERIQRSTARLIEKHQTVYETLAPTEEPLSGRWWKKTKAFAWSAGLFLWAEANLLQSSAYATVTKDFLNHSTYETITLHR